MATVSKTLTWQSTVGSVDHYEIGIGSTASSTPVVIYTTSDATTSATIQYDSSTYPTAWIFIRAIDSTGAASEWSDPVSAASLTPTFTPPQSLQYAYANDITDLLVGFTLPAAYTNFRLNKICLEASRQIDKETDSRFSTQTIVEKYDGNGTSELTLRHYPIIAINYAQVNTGSGVEIIREYTSSDLELSDFEAGIITLKPVTIDNLDTSWQTAASLLYGHIFPQGKSNIEVSYTYGYLEYTEGEELQLTSSATNGSSGVVTRTYQAIHHNWATNNISIYQNGSLLMSNYSVDAKTGIVSIVGGADTDTITANYYATVPHDIEMTCAKLAAISVINQIAANSTGGITAFRNMNYQETYGTRPFSNVIDGYRNDIDKVISRYRRYDIQAI